MYYVYILQSIKDRKTYVGYTSNLVERIKSHNAGKVPSTSYRRPLKLLKYEAFPIASEAKKRELWWKSGAGRRKLKEFFNLIQGGPPNKEQAKIALHELRTLGGKIMSEHQ